MRVIPPLRYPCGIYHSKGFHGNFDTKAKMVVLVLPGAVQLARPFPVRCPGPAWIRLGPAGRSIAGSYGAALANSFLLISPRRES